MCKGEGRGWPGEGVWGCGADNDSWYIFRVSSVAATLTWYAVDNRLLTLSCSGCTTASTSCSEACGWSAAATRHTTPSPLLPLLLPPMLPLLLLSLVEVLSPGPLLLLLLLLLLVSLRLGVGAFEWLPAAACWRAACSK